MKLRKFLCLFVIASLVFIISGCGGSNHKAPYNPNQGSNTIYSTDESSRNALLITEGSPTYENIDVYKTGDATGDNYDKIGDNAAILAMNGATPMISNAAISTDAVGANAVFAYGGGTNDGTRIIIQSSDIYTYKNNSGGIMVTGGGKIDATNLNIETYGQSSAAIRSDQGGGEIVVDKGTYTTHGQGSPAIYSVASVTVKEADLITKEAQGIVIEGGNSVTLDHVNVTADHKTRDSDETTNQAVLLYQPDTSSTENAKFTMTSGTIDNTTGDIFCITNTDAEINLTDVTITNNDTSGIFLRAEAQKWGNNGGNVTLNASNQNISGDMLIDDKSSLTMNLEEANFMGAINKSGTNGTVEVLLDSDSTWTLTDNSNISILSGDGNVNYGVYTLRVDGYSYNASMPYDPNGTVSRDVTVEVPYGGAHAIAQSTGTHHYENINITKSGNVEEADAAYNSGANAAVLSSGDANITIRGTESLITTYATYATAIYANGGKISVNDAKIRTSGNNSDALTAANGGTITANNLDASTSGLLSAGIRTINGGTVTANSSVFNSSSQGIVMDGGNSISLSDVTLTAPQAILLSGDNNTLTIEGGTITNTTDEVIRLSNAKGTINLSRVSITNNATPRVFLNSETDNSDITIETSNQEISGTINTGSTLKLNLRNGTNFNGSINSTGSRGIVNVILDTGARWTLDADTYVTTMSNNGGTLVRNGHSIYENGVPYTK